ncbi:MAG: YjbQ family protein [Desulfovibrionaceae bacterium]|nr:YjbQ family protein [Desulfovibrionaceae bacterium]
METLNVRTDRRVEMQNITAELEALIARKGWRDGLLALHCPHTTAGLAVNEAADPSVARDIAAALASLAPREGGYTHAEGNSDAHIKSCLTGAQLTLFVEQGRLLLGTWQGIFFCEFDGPRSRQLWAKWLPGGEERGGPGAKPSGKNQ